MRSQEGEWDYAVEVWPGIADDDAESESPVLFSSSIDVVPKLGPS